MAPQKVVQAPASRIAGILRLAKTPPLPTAEFRSDAPAIVHDRFRICAQTEVRRLASVAWMNREGDEVIGQWDKRMELNPPTWQRAGFSTAAHERCAHTTYRQASERSVERHSLRKIERRGTDGRIRLGPGGSIERPRPGDDAAIRPVDAAPENHFASRSAKNPRRGTRSIDERPLRSVERPRRFAVIPDDGAGAPSVARTRARGRT